MLWEITWQCRRRGAGGGGVRWDRFAGPAPAVFSRAQEDADRSRSVTDADFFCGAHEPGVSGGELQAGKKQTITLC